MSLEIAPQLSSEMAFEDFLRIASLVKVRIAFERTPPPASHRRAQAYQSDTEAITEALRVGSRVRLEGVMFGLVMAA